MTTPIKVQRGDLVLVRPAAPASGVRPGFYTVLEEGPGGISVMPFAAESAIGNNAKIQPADVGALFHPDFLRLDRLPEGNVDVTTPPPPAPKPVTPKRRPDEKLVVVSVGQPGRREFQMGRRATSDAPQERVVMTCFQSRHTNKGSGGRSQLAIAVPADLVKNLLRTGEGGLYVITDEVVPIPEGVTYSIPEAGRR